MLRGRPMNSFDFHTVSFLNQFAHLSGVLNNCLFLIEQSNLLTWVPITALLWWAWFKGDGQEDSNRKLVVTTIVAVGLVTIFFYFCDRHALIGFRSRPMFNPQLNFQTPSGIQLPSPDSYWGKTRRFRAVMLCIRRPWCWPPIYFLNGGYLGPDLFSSRLFGKDLLRHPLPERHHRWCMHRHCAVLFARTKLIDYLLTRRLIKWPMHHPSSFYAVFFIVTYSVATGFQELKALPAR